MWIAVLSDIHDHIWNLKKVLPRIQHAEACLFLGDFCAPFTLAALAEGFQKPIHAVRGNNDGDMYLLQRNAQQAGNVTLYTTVCRIELGGRKLAAIHYSDLAEEMAMSGKYDAVFGGHSHMAEVRMIENTLYANPGEVMGRLGQPSFGLYDTASNWMELHRITEER